MRDDGVLDLGKEALREIATPVVEAAGNPKEPFGIYVFGADEPEAELARAIERQVFLEVFGNPAELLAEEYGPYEDTTVFFVVIDHRRRLPAGQMRLILPSERGLKTFHDIGAVWGADPDRVLAATDPDVDPALVWDVATLAVEAEYRGSATDGLVSIALQQTLVQSVLVGEGRWLVSILDLKPLELIQMFAAAPFHRFAGLDPLSYLDSPLSVPVIVDFREWEPRLLADNPNSYDILWRGTGIEHAMRPPAWAALARTLGKEPARPVLVRR